MSKDYYLGLDIGTNSIGWAVTDTDYNIMKFRNNAMWGIRLFDESNTAETRRTFRSNRRRTKRKVERLNFLEMLFDVEISKTDRSFFQRLKDSNLYYEDKSIQEKYVIFNDKDYTDKNFYKDYPTIYHLRKELIENNKPHDIRLVFLAIHHIIKNRGHFLFNELSSDGIRIFSEVYSDIENYLSDNYEIELSCNNVAEFCDILKNRNLTKRTKNEALFKLFSATKKDNPQLCACLSLLSGSSVSLCDIFNDENLKNAEKNKINFESDLTENESVYQCALGERYELIEKLKALYDWAILANILNDDKFISFAKVKIFDQHKSDLAILKNYIKTYLSKEYKTIFSTSSKSLNNYPAYVGIYKLNGKKRTIEKTCTQQEFCDYLKSKLKKCEDNKFCSMFERIETGSFMPKQVNKDNGVIPMQVHREELIRILENAKSYLTFLTEKDNDGITVADKIISIFDYRIPYYVGPLNPHSPLSWIERREGKIYPWTFEKMVDTDKSAEKFIEKLTNKCTYLVGENVLAKNSILYSKFIVLNELNNLKIDSKPIDISLKQDIFNDLFMKHNKVTDKILVNYLKRIRNIDFETVSGIDGGFKSNLKPLRDFEEFDQLSISQKEDIIHAITVFAGDKRLLLKRLKTNYSDFLSDEEIKKICKFKYTDWGRLSKKFLSEIKAINKTTGELQSIISVMWETNLNLMELLYSETFNFQEVIKDYNSLDSQKTLREAVENLYVSPKVKRPIYQSLQIIKEIEKTQKCSPKKIFIEVARDPQNDKKRTISRKEKLLELYKSCKKEYSDLYETLLATEDDKFKQDKLYLYYTQFGRCMYTGEIIDLNNLLGSNSYYDIDHIFPQSKLKDDSLDNRVLALKSYNNNIKSDHYPLNADTRNKMTPFWKMLLAKDLISQKKFDRLMRYTPLSDDELSAFISRQLVETRQSTKAVAKILEEMYPNSDIVYVKAKLVSDFRQKYEMLKCRDVNDLHHAKDAYLNIVVGNVYDVKVTKDKRNFIKGLQKDGKESISLNRIFDYDIKGAWIAENNKSIETVKKTMTKNNIRYTLYSYCQNGGLFDQNILKKGNGQVPIKANSCRANIQKYGGYNKASCAFFSFVEYANEKNKLIRILLPINNYQLHLYNENPVKFAKAQLSDDKFSCNQVKIIIPCVKYGSCISFDGFRMTITKKSGNQIGYRCAIQLVLSDTQEKYCKKISNYLDKNSHREVNSFDKLSSEENIALFDILLDKMTNTVFSVKFKDIGQKITQHRDDFVKLNLKEQCIIIRSLLNMLHCNALAGDLSLIGEAKNAGIIVSNAKLSEIKNIKSIKLINQSITGLYEQEFDLI